MISNYIMCFILHSHWKNKLWNIVWEGLYNLRCRI